MAKLPKKRKSRESSFSIDACKCRGRIISSELSDLKTKPNKAIILEFKVMDGENKGRTVKQWYNIIHTKEEVQNIAYDELDHIAFCCGLKGYKDTSELHGIDLSLDITLVGKYNDVSVKPFEKKKKKKDNPF